MLGAMTTRPRFMHPRSIGPIGWLVPYTMSPFVMIGPIFMLWFFEGTNWTWLIYPLKNLNNFWLFFMVSPAPTAPRDVILFQSSLAEYIAVVCCGGGGGGAIKEITRFLISTQ